ncbi:Helix-turn-helix domain-containing protein [Mucilaginibacter gossypiicola]|uniref:Helix-turn-helix domain-containing protein n=1 Tax=Mucilaginibacter gossypiicola TaxID=551995 RepID=A0A1H8HME5_9SPHI|nr:helix-turn-helix domain-containing protein [Mucilaginibacter gossypiicola]SEN57284.1 Helix-turn-helix domain-containing protein [Mucilaginibacter gossypiicola]
MSIYSENGTGAEKKGQSQKLVTIEDLQHFKADMLFEIGKLLKGGNSKPEKKWLKSREVRKLLEVSPGKLQWMRKSGVLSYLRIGGSIYYDPADIDKMFEKSKVSSKG